MEENICIKKKKFLKGEVRDVLNSLLTTVVKQKS